MLHLFFEGVLQSCHQFPCCLLRQLGLVVANEEQSGFQMTAEVILLPPITTGASSTINQSEFQAIICNLLKPRVQGVIGCGFASHWLKN